MDLPIYYLIISFACCFGIWWFVQRTDRASIPRPVAIDLALILMISGFIGGRLLHVIYEAPDFYADNPILILHFWNGGFVYFGGMILAALAAFLFLRYRQQNIPRVFDLFAPLGAMTYALGRLGCYWAGCCYGRICEWGSWRFQHPTQLYAFVWETILLGGLLWLEKNRARSRWLKNPGSLFATWILGHAVGRLGMEYFRADDRGPAPLGLSLATWISLVLLTGAVFFQARQIRSRKS